MILFDGIGHIPDCADKCFLFGLRTCRVDLAAECLREAEALWRERYNAKVDEVIATALAEHLYVFGLR